MENIGTLNEKETSNDNESKLDVDSIKEQVRAELIKEQQFEEMKKQQELMKKELDELRNKSIESSEGVKGVVSEKKSDKYSQTVNSKQENPNQEVFKEFNPTQRDDWKNKVNEIAEGFNKWYDDISKPTPSDLVGFQQSYRGRPQDGFAELIRLQSMLKSHEMKKPGESDDQHRARLSYLSQRPSDEMVLSRRREY